MARIAQEHEELQSKMGESEEKRRRTKRALKEALEGVSAHTSRRGSKVASRIQVSGEDSRVGGDEAKELIAQPMEYMTENEENESGKSLRRKRSALSRISSLYDSGSDDDDEFFDAIDAGEIEVEDMTTSKVMEKEKEKPELESTEPRAAKRDEIVPSFKGYEEPVRTRLKLDNDNRPKISLWVSDCEYMLKLGFKQSKVML